MWELMHKDPGGHKLFLDQSDGSYRHPWPRIYVADNSGFTPDKTEDGVLEIDQDKIGRLKFTPSTDGKALTCYVPVRRRAFDGDKAESVVGLSTGCAVALAGRWGLRMFLEAPYLTVPIQLEAGNLI